MTKRINEIVAEYIGQFRLNFPASSADIIMGLILYLAIAVVYLIYKWGTQHYNYFKDLGIPFVKPFFLLGSNTNLITKKYALPDQIAAWYNEFYDSK